MEDLRIGQRVEVLGSKVEDGAGGEPGQGPRVPGDWEPGTIVGLHLTSVHIQIDNETTATAFPAAARGKTWRPA